MGRDVCDEVWLERQRQIEAEGWTPEHDDQWSNGALARAARCYIAHADNYAGASEVGYRLSEPPSYWPWERQWWKPKDRRRDLVRAAALIVAEIERIDRAAK